MGPLYTHGLINDEWNLFLAFIIGIGFGFVLERAGFSSSRRLVGTFYGYDLTVLKVFFTAAVTSMLGILVFNYMGWIDFNPQFVFISPTFIYSAIIGGVLMGTGMAFSGFCPGTSLSALGIGKIDALIFLIGAGLGILLFGLLYPWIEGIYKGASLGSVTVPELLGIAEGVFALIIAAVAVGAFYIGEWAEKKFARPDIVKEL